jgi:arabinogalactan endo-1,4-beta-galactosidase
VKEFHFDPQFALGADTSWLPQMEISGFPFRNRAGREQDCLCTLREYGLNSLRLRTWVNPSEDSRSGHCSAQETVAMAVRGIKAGYRIMIDFHYGDTWCDPGHQAKPAAWKALSFEKLVEAVFNYTRDTMNCLVDSGVTPEWVQIGNETNPGMLLPDGSSDNFSNLTALYNAGYDAIKKTSPTTKIIIHLAEGNNTSFCRNYFDELTKYGCRYDIIGLSYYPWWLNKPNEEIIHDLAQSMHELPEKYDKDIMIVEVGGSDEDEDESYALLTSVIEQCALIPRCKGIFYWEPEGAQVWSGYKLSAWQTDGRPTHAMDAFLSVKKQ